jgi:hypothetical protein
MKAKLIYQMPNNGYQSDILMRIYPNQERKNIATDFEDGWYCGDIYSRNGASSKYEGVISANHPQGVQFVMESLLKEQSENDVSIEIENGMSNGRPHPDCRDEEWFTAAIENAIRGDFKNSDMAKPTP